jgi:hypothetical protein
MRRYTDAERRRAVKDFECGGISAAEFCRRRGMSSVSLAQWRRRYSGNAHSVPAAVPPWLPVVIADADQPAADFGVVYVMIAGTRRLEVSVTRGTTSHGEAEMAKVSDYGIFDFGYAK